MSLDPEDHLLLARAVAGRYRSAPDFEAVVGAAVLELVRQAPNFEQARGTTPGTFLWFHLLGAAREEARRQWRHRAERLYVLTDEGDEQERPDLPPVEPTAERDALGRQIREAVAALPERQARIVVACYGLDGSDPLTCREVAEREGLSPQRVRQIRAKAEARLRRRLRPRRFQKLASGTARR